MSKILNAKVIAAVIFLAALVAVPVLATQSETASEAIQIASASKEVNMHPEYAKSIARMAYIWGYPMVNMMNRRAALSQAPEPGRLGGVLPASPTGQIAMLYDYIDPGQNFIACPNQDVVYGLGFMSLDEQPVIIQVPDIGDRFWVYAIYDARTEQVGQLGKPYGSKPGFYLLAGPNWQGEVPAGVNEVLRSPTAFANVIPRLFMDDTDEDRTAIQPIINQVVVYPLSDYDGKMKTKDWKKAPVIPNPSSGGGETKRVVPEKYFDQLREVLKTVPPLPGEETLYGQMAALLAVAEKDPEIKKTITETAKELDESLIKDFLRWKYNGKPAGNGWNRSLHNAEWGLDYFNRTGTARSNMFDNRPNETQYFYTDNTSDGEQLDGNKSYSITFPSGQLPPVKGFWSMTLYNEHHFFHPNDLKRYSLGTKNKELKKNADGSLTLYAGANSPGADKESNWIPAPEGAFSLYIRAYWGEQGILDGSWKPPVVKKVVSSAATAAGAKAPETASPLVRELYEGNWPTEAEAQKLLDELYYQRAIYAYMTMLPALNVIGMRDGSEKIFGGGYNVLPIWKDRMDSRCWVPTPNADVIYSMSYLNLKETGPLVVAAPPNVIGMFTDFFQRTITDVGLIGPDRARGGLYLLLPPGYEGHVPSGYFAFESSTYNVFLFFRTIMTKGPEGPNPAPAVATAERTRIYPLWEEEKNIKPMVFPNGSGKRVNMMYPVDNEYWTKLKQFVDYEPVTAITPELRGVLASIGIIKGKPFNPTPRQQELLKKAVETAPKMILALRLKGRLDKRHLYYKDRQYERAWAAATAEYMQESYLDVDQRACFFQYAYSSAPAMVMRTIDAGSKYPVTARDADGNFLNGSHHYKLHLPAGIPAKLFWAVTLYNVTDGTMPETPQLLPSKNGFENTVKNRDGSIDLFFGPTQPEGVADTNWIQTVEGRDFITCIRLYGTGIEFFDQTWKPDDVVKID